MILKDRSHSSNPKTNYVQIQAVFIPPKKLYMLQNVLQKLGKSGSTNLLLSGYNAYDLGIIPIANSILQEYYKLLGLSV